jgi:glutamine amidotransferase
MIHPIVDEFYSPNPAHERSAGFAQAKGQTVTGPDKRVLTGKNLEEAESGDESRPLRKDVVGEATRRLRVE